MMAERNARDLDDNDREENKEPKEKPGLFSGITATGMFVGLVYVFAFSYLLSYVFQAGKFREFKVPLNLMEFNSSIFLVNFSLLLVASISTLVAILLRLVNGKKIENRTEKVTDFFAAITTAIIAAYFVAAFYLSLAAGRFPMEGIYIFVLYAIVVFFYFMRSKTRLGHNLVAAGFMISIMISIFYFGIVKAEIESKLVTKIGDETFCLVGLYDDNMILSGYIKNSNVFTGRIKIISKRDSVDLVFSRQNI